MLRLMQPHRPVLTQHRRRRLVLWALTLMQWFAAVFCNTQRISKRHLAQRGDVSLQMLTRIVTNIVILSGATLLGRIPRARHNWRRGRHLGRTHLRRSLLGAKLRRALKHKDMRTHIAQLIDVLRNLDHYAAALAKRFRRLRRLWRIMPPIAAAEAILGPPAASPALADSS